VSSLATASPAQAGGRAIVFIGQCAADNELRALSLSSRRGDSEFTSNFRQRECEAGCKWAAAEDLRSLRITGMSSSPGHPGRSYRAAEKERIQNGSPNFDGTMRLSYAALQPGAHPVSGLHYLRSHWLANSYFVLGDIMDACEMAWNGSPHTGLVRSLCAAAWAPVCPLYRWCLYRPWPEIEAHSCNRNFRRSVLETGR